MEGRQLGQAGDGGDPRGWEGERLSILSSVRAKPAVPFGGKYRIIDFTLSNCVNSGIDDVVVLTQYNPRSLHDHIGTGRPWDLDRNSGRHPDAAAVHQARACRPTGTAAPPMPSFRTSTSLSRRARDLLILAGDHIYKMDYEPMVLVRPPSAPRGRERSPSGPIPSPSSRMGELALDEGVVLGFQEKPARHRRAPRSPRWASTFLDARCSRWPRDDAEDLRARTISARTSSRQFLDGGASVYAHRFADYWQDVGTMDSFYLANPTGAPRRVRRLDLSDPDWMCTRFARRTPPAEIGRSAGPSLPDLARLRDQRDGRQQRRSRPVSGSTSRRRRARLDRHVRHGRPLGRGRRPRDRGQGGRRRSDGDRRYRPDFDSRPPEPGRLNTGITVVGGSESSRGEFELSRDGSRSRRRDSRPTTRPRRPLRRDHDHNRAVPGPRQPLTATPRPR